MGMIGGILIIIGSTIKAIYRNVDWVFILPKNRRR